MGYVSRGGLVSRLHSVAVLLRGCAGDTFLGVSRETPVFQFSFPITVRLTVCKFFLGGVAWRV